MEPRANGNSENIQSLSSRRQRNHQLIDYSNFPHTRINNVYWLIFKTQKSENCVVWFFRIYRILPERITGRDKGETGSSLVSVQIMSVELQWPASAPPLDIGLLMSESDTATPRPAPPPPRPRPLCRLGSYSLMPAWVAATRQLRAPSSGIINLGLSQILLLIILEPFLLFGGWRDLLPKHLQWSEETRSK